MFIPYINTNTNKHSYFIIKQKTIMFLLLTLALQFFLVASHVGHNHNNNLRSSHKCLHSSLKIPTPNEKTRSSQKYDTNVQNIKNTDVNSQHILSNRRLSGRSNMRIHIEYSSALSGSSTTLDANLKSWTQQAATYWESTLKVLPVQNNLKFDLTCDQSYTFTDTSETQCNTYSTTETCGGESIPSTWLKGGRTCSTCYETGGPSACTGCTDIAGSSGLSNSDYAIMVTSSNTPTCQNSPSTLGYASPCRFDQYDRPILGSMNYCPLAMASSTASVALSTAKHEMAHALGFTASMIPYFRDSSTSTLSPRTARDGSGNPPTATKVCADGVSRPLVAPETTTLNGPTNMRGFINSFILVTPNVAKAAKEHFKCTTLNGIELENQPTGDVSSCWGAHWEQRILHTELMAPVVSQNSVVSEFTLAFFEDTGWYESDYSKAEYLYFGKNAGCNFVNSKCNTGTADSPIMQLKEKGYFCDTEYVAPYTETMTGCTHNGLSKGHCNKKTFTQDISPSSFQYFTNSREGGELTNLDYCPIYSGFSNGDCSDTTHQEPDSSNYYGDLYGSTSKCIESTTIHSGYQLPTMKKQVCAAIVCNSDGTSATVTLKDDKGALQTVTCTESDQSNGKVVPNFNAGGKITCPDLGVYCKTGKTTFVGTEKKEVVNEPIPAPAPSPSDDGLSKENFPSDNRGAVISIHFCGIVLFLLCLAFLGH